MECGLLGYHSPESVHFIEARTRSMYESISIKVSAANDSKDKINMLANCPLATFAQGLCCHVFAVLNKNIQGKSQW
jgi:hypothetical protein